MCFSSRLGSHLSSRPVRSQPKGYYDQILAKIVAAGDKVKSESGARGILLAQVPLNSVNSVGGKLAAELNQTVGKND